MDASKANQLPSTIPPNQPVNHYPQEGVAISPGDLYPRQGYEGIPESYVMPVAGARLSFSFPTYGKERIEGEAPDEKVGAASVRSPSSRTEGPCRSATR